MHNCILSRLSRARTAAMPAVPAAACCVALSVMPGVARAEGPDAIQYLPGCGDNILYPNDDDYAGPVDIGFDIDFQGVTWSSLFVNNNGNVTFDEPLLAYTPDPLDTLGAAIIAPFFADVDTTGAASGVVTWGQTVLDGRPALCVNWAGVGVGYYEMGDDKLNSFQLLLVDRSDVGAGDFDIVMNYDKIEWESGDASGGVNGLGGQSARVGFSNGDPASSFEVAGSGVPGSFLDASPTGLIHGSSGSAQLGRYVYPIRSSQACPDADGDGVTACDGDCDDGDPGIFPGASEVCDGADNDCDGDADEGGACTPTCVEIRDGVGGASAEDALLSGDYPAWPAGTYFGAYTGASSGGNRNRSLFWFDLSPVVDASGGVSVTVTSATLGVSVAWNEVYTNVNVHRALGPWDEATVTANSYPSGQWEAAPLASFAAGGVGRREIDVTDLAQQWLDGAAPNNGVLFDEPGPGSHAFYTRESSQPAIRPSLEVCFVPQ